MKKPSERIKKIMEAILSGELSADVFSQKEISAALQAVIAYLDEHEHRQKNQSLPRHLPH